MNKSSKVFSAWPIYQAHKQLNTVARSDGWWYCFVCLTENDITLARYIVSGPEVARLIAETESDLSVSGVSLSSQRYPSRASCICV